VCSAYDLGARSHQIRAHNADADGELCHDDGGTAPLLIPPIAVMYGLYQTGNSICSTLRPATAREFEPEIALNLSKRASNGSWAVSS